MDSSDIETFFEKLAANNCQTHAVGEKRPNAWGLYDMHGNVWEWCEDQNGSNRVFRGGGWSLPAWTCRSASGSSNVPSTRANGFGFRLALDFPSVPTINAGGAIFKVLPEGPNGPFSIGIHEVTQSQYEAVMGINPSASKVPNEPVENVSWDDAVAFCAKLSALPAELAAGRVYRLPTEAEWEYACRAGTTTEYSFGDDAKDLGKYAWFDDNSGQTTHAVGEKRPNAWGLYDMHGNVWEWCSDEEGSRRVYRGGGWYRGAALCRTASRSRSGPSFRSNFIGFRLALSSQSGVSSPAEQVQGK